MALHGELSSLLNELKSEMYKNAGTKFRDKMIILKVGCLLLQLWKYKWEISGEIGNVIDHYWVHQYDDLTDGLECFCCLSFFRLQSWQAVTWRNITKHLISKTI